MEKKLIEDIYNEKAKNDSNSEDLANTLNILSKTVFGDINRFVFELLQNADDSPNNKKTNTLDVIFQLFDNYLIFSHNGKHFDYSDVKGISRVGSQDSQKDKEIEKTGYKGIGFKSIFRTSDCVQIISNGYKFKFDKNHHIWQNDKSYPWQVIPIWHDEIPSELTSHIDFSRVNTIIKIDNNNILYSEILNVFEDCQIILFLRNVNSIQFKRNETQEFEIVKKKIDNNTYELLYNGDLKSRWYLSDFTIDIEEDLRNKLSKLSDEECPTKLKSAKKTKLTYAIYTEEDNLKSLENTIIYNYLPTKVDYSLPYIVNGDFITNAERTQLLVNEWNEFLLQQIALNQINLLVELNATKFKYDILNLLKGKFTYTSDSLKNAFNNSLSKAIKEIAFVPNKNESKLLKAHECLIDSLEYTKYFSEEHIVSLFENTPSLICPSLVRHEKLINFQASKFDADQLSELIKSEAFIASATTDKKFSCNFILFLYNKVKSIDNLQKEKFILNSDSRLAAPEELYFPSRSFTRSFSFAELSFVDSDVFTEIDKYEDLKKWLKELGIKFPTDVEILRKSIFPMINQTLITTDNTLEITQFIFKLFSNGELTDNDYTTLRKIYLLTQNGLKLAVNTYLSDAYEPVLKLEGLVPEQDYISIDYLSQSSDREKWKKFFLRLYVKEKITVVKFNQLERSKLISKVPDASGYLDWVDDNHYYDSIYYPYRNSGQHSVSNFKYFYFLNHLSSFKFAKLFWDIILNDWSNYSLDNPKTRYGYRGGSVNIPDYLSYYVRNFQSIPATDKVCYKSTEVYSPKFKNIIGEKYPVADFKSNLLSKEQISYLGVRQFIEIDNCIDILSSFVEEEISNENKKQIFSVYEEILKSFKDGNRISMDVSNITLLSLNNTFRPIQNLHYFKINTLSPPVNSDSFIQFQESLSNNDKELFCDIFNISMVTYSDLIFTHNNSVKDDTLKNKLSEILPYLSIIIAHKQSSEFDKIYSALKSVISSTTVFQSDTLTLLYKNREDEVIFNSTINTWHENENFYFSGNWSSPLTLYSLCSLLSDYLKVENIDRELSLFLQINKENIVDWLNEQGYEIPNLNTLSVQDYDFPEGNDSNDGVEEEKSGINYSESITIEEFNPEVEAKVANTTNVKVSNVSHESTSFSNSSKDYSKLSNDVVKIDIGRWSEEYIFKYLKDMGIYSSVKWMNEKEEAYLPYDFIIVDGQIEKYIEVKGTPSSDKGEFYMSKNEWSFMFEKKGNYSIYRLFSAGKKEDLEIKIITKPYLLIQSGKMLPESISVFI